MSDASEKIVPQIRFQQLTTLAQLSSNEDVRNAIILQALNELGLDFMGVQHVVTLCPVSDESK